MKLRYFPLFFAFCPMASFAYNTTMPVEIGASHAVVSSVQKKSVKKERLAIPAWLQGQWISHEGKKGEIELTSLITAHPHDLVYGITIKSEGHIIGPNPPLDLGKDTYIKEQYPTDREYTVTFDRDKVLTTYHLKYISPTAVQFSIDQGTASTFHKMDRSV